ncbi:MAG TPA: potassium channel family protein [Sphingomicrobium sp.]|nr:potassium channel family protein [Sphingomicrobium sp.]
MIGRWRLLRELECWLEKPMIVLSLAWLAVVVVELTAGEYSLLTGIGIAIWAIFVAEFAIRALAPEKLPFVQRNWLTLIALVVPAFRLLRAFALFRAAGVLRGARLVRVIGTINRSMNALGRTLRRRGFGYVVALTLVVLLAGAAGMLSFERTSAAGGGFTSYWHALWWTGMLLASLGTDFWPQTVEGRLLSSLLALYGLGVFGYITATIASYFIDRDARDPKADVAGSDELRRLRREIAALRATLGFSNLSQNPG